MLRKIIKIDPTACNGCGLCVTACHEKAIVLVDGKAVLQRDDYCDGLGDCLPVCPTDAITFEVREALEYNEMEVKRNIQQEKIEQLPCGCPSTNAKTLIVEDTAQSAAAQPAASQLRQWPVQIKLVPVHAPYFENASLLIAADCTAYAYGNFHQDFMRHKVTLIGCPKLDDTDYSKKLATIFKDNAIKSVTVIRMEVPCCGGIENAVRAALKDCGKKINLQVVIISTDGHRLT